MDAVNRVKLAMWYKRRAFLMLKCFGVDRGNEWFAKAAKKYFAEAREQIGLARVAAGMVKLRGWWVTECGNRSVLVYAYSAEEAVGIARASGDWFGDDQDIALLETSVRPMAHIKPSVIAWASDLSFEL